jgi:hypothetical protein
MPNGTKSILLVPAPGLAATDSLAPAAYEAWSQMAISGHLTIKLGSVAAWLGVKRKRMRSALCWMTSTHAIPGEGMQGAEHDRRPSEEL